MSLPSWILASHKIEKLVLNWLEEDIPSFDYGAQAVGDKWTTATLYAKSQVRYIRACIDHSYGYIVFRVYWQANHSLMPSFNILVAQCSGKSLLMMDVV